VRQHLDQNFLQVEIGLLELASFSVGQGHRFLSQQKAQIMRTSAFDSPKAASHGRRQQHFIGAENIDNLRRNLASCQEALQTTRCWQQDTQCALDQTVQQLQWVLNTLAQRDGELAVAGRTFTAQETELRRCRALLKKRTVAMKEEEAAKHIYGQALKVEV
jgi:hypothetical protein